jgi:hypothetical protein
MGPDPEVLAPPAPPLVLAALVGHWRIRAMELWLQEDVETLGPALVRLNRHGRGQMTFLCVQARLDCQPTERDGRPALEFSWEGSDDGDHRCGRGWLRLGDTDDSILGRFFFHQGDNSAFTAERVAADAVARRSRRTRRR